MGERVVSGSHWGLFHPRVENNRVTKAEPFHLDPDPSPILDSIPDLADHPCRILRPAVRKGYLQRGGADAGRVRGGEPFVEVPWDEALDLVSQAIGETREQHGNEAIYAGSYGWGSTGKLHNASNLLHRFFNTVGGFTGSSGTYSLAAGEVILPRILGGQGQTSSWQTLLGTCDLHVSFGGMPMKNSQITHGGMSRHTTREWLQKLHQQGTRFINVSPIRDDLMAELGAQWIAIRPNSDVAFMLGIAHTLVSTGLHSEQFLQRYCHGSEPFFSYLHGDLDGQPKDAEWAAQLCDIEAGTIRQLATKLAGNRSFLNAAWSLQRADHGEQPFWMVMTLACLLGQIGQPGCGFGYGYGAMGGIGELNASIRAPGLPPGNNPLSSVIPVSRIVEMLENPGASYQFNGETRRYPDIELIYWAGGNPFHHHQDINRLLRAWQKPATVIVQESFWTATARHADIVLPVATTLERDDIGWGFMDRYCYTMPALQPIPGDARLEWDIFTDLARRFGVEQAFTDGLSADEWLQRIYQQTREAAAKVDWPLPDYEVFKRQRHVELPAHGEPTPAYADFIEAPAENPLRTPSGKFEIFSEAIDSFNYDDCPGHPAWQEPAEWLGNASPEQLHLISNQPYTRLHSQLDFGRYSIESKIQGREPVQIHPDDAAAREIADGDLVRLFNQRGSCLAGAIVSDTVRPGVLQLATGAWYDPLVAGEIGTLDVHGNPNMLTLDKGTSQLAQGPISQTTLVEIEKWSGAAPPIRVFSPPELLDSEGDWR